MKEAIISTWHDRRSLPVCVSHLKARHGCEPDAELTSHGHVLGHAYASSAVRWENVYIAIEESTFYHLEKLGGGSSPDMKAVVMQTGRRK